MEWMDDGIVLATRRLGESGSVGSLLTRDHGRHPGMIPGGGGKAMRPLLQPGTLVQAHWRARLTEQLGTFRLEMQNAYPARILDQPGPLAALTSACALCEALLPERQPFTSLFLATQALFEALTAPSWPSVYVHWELALLRGLGFGLDLSACAATGETENLIYVSPKSARAVSAEAGRPHAHKLLPLPAFLLDRSEGDDHAITQGLALTGYFLERHPLHLRHMGMPAPRMRLVDRFRSSSTMAGSRN